MQLRANSKEFIERLAPNPIRAPSIPKYHPINPRMRRGREVTGGVWRTGEELADDPDDGPAGSVRALHADHLELLEVGEVVAEVVDAVMPLLAVDRGGEERRAGVHHEVGAYHHHREVAPPPPLPEPDASAMAAPPARESLIKGRCGSTGRCWMVTEVARIDRNSDA